MTLTLTRRELLCRRGFFPRELPPCFNSDTLNEKAIAGALPALSGTKVPWCRADRFSSARRSHGRRLLHIVNPIPYMQLANQIDLDWGNLSSHLTASPVTKDVIGFDDESVRGIRIQSSSTPSKNAAVDSLAFTASLELDIAKCYSSIYTHVITWALSGKHAAKSNTNRIILGSMLDKYIAACNEGQTKGITVGQDTSRILAEVVLASVDISFHERMSTTPYLARRYIDDYRVYVENTLDAQHSMYALSQAAMEYELEINSEKTRINDLATNFEADWVSQARDAIKLALSNSEVIMISGFAKIFSLHRVSQDENLMRFFVESLYRLRFSVLDNKLVCSLLIKVAELSPNTLDSVILLFILVKAHGKAFPAHPIARLSAFSGGVTEGVR